MDPQVASLAELFDLNTYLLLNCLEGLGDRRHRGVAGAGGDPRTLVEVSPHLQKVLARLGAAELREPGVHRFPVGDSTFWA